MRGVSGGKAKDSEERKLTTAPQLTRQARRHYNLLLKSHNETSEALKPLQRLALHGITGNLTVENRNKNLKKQPENEVGAIDTTKFLGRPSSTVGSCGLYFSLGRKLCSPRGRAEHNSDIHYLKRYPFAYLFLCQLCFARPSPPPLIPSLPLTHGCAPCLVYSVIKIINQTSYSHSSSRVPGIPARKVAYDA